MKINISLNKTFDAVEFTASEDWQDCTFEEFKEHLIMCFHEWPDEFIDYLVIKEVGD